MRIPLLSALLVLAAAAPAAAQSPWTYRSEAGYSLDLPARWVQAPEEALDVVRGQFEGDDVILEAGFQLSDASWPIPPVVALGRMDFPGPVTVEEFSAEFTAPGSQANMQEGVDETPAAQLGAQIGVPRWDAGTRAAWVRMAMQSDGTSPSFAWSAMMLTPDGRAMVVLAYYGPPGANETAVLAELKSVVRSLRQD